MSLNYPSIYGAAGSVVGVGGTALWAAGAAVATTGKGVYTLTLDEPVNAAACTVLATSRGAVANIATVVQTSPAVKTVNLVDNLGVAIDGDFDFVVLRAPLS